MKRNDLLATVAVWESALSPTRGWDVLSALKFLLRPQARYSRCPGIGLKKRLEVAAGLEPAKTGFADQRLDRFGIATKPCKTCTKPGATWAQVYTQNCTQNAPATPICSDSSPCNLLKPC